MLTNVDESYVTSRQNDDWNKIHGSVETLMNLKTAGLSTQSTKDISRRYCAAVHRSGKACNLNIFVLFVDPMFLQDEPVRADE